MAEWSIAPVLKTDVLRGTGGSNPSLSAKVADYQRLLLFTANFDYIIKRVREFGYIVSISQCSQLKNAQFEKTRYKEFSSIFCTKIAIYLRKITISAQKIK